MLLINPATEQFGGILSRYVPVGIPVAIGTLAAYLKKAGHTVRVADDEIEKLNEENLQEHLEQMEAPYIFGISVLTSQAARAYEIIRLIRKKVSDPTIIVGGIHATALPEEAIQHGADFVIRGEGEVPLLRLFDALKHGTDWTKIESLTFRRQDGLIQNNPDGPLIENLDDIPMFPYELFQHSRYDLGFVTSSRGCPYRCTYCSQRLMTGLSYRYRSTEKVVEELDVLINRFGQTHIVFYDDNFSIKRTRVIDLCRGIIERGLHEKCTFNVQTRADNFYEDLLPHLKAANFVGVGFGMETGVERLAQEIVKGETVDTHLKAIESAKKFGIEVTLFMIFGLPSETHEDRMASYELTKKLGIKFTKFNNLIPYPGTKLYQQVKDTPGISVLPLWKNFNSTLTSTRSIFNALPLPYVPEGTTSWELKRDIFRCNMGFYFTPRIFLNLFREKRGPGFVKLPKGWFLKPQEVYEMAKLGSILFSNFLIALLPKKIGFFLVDSVVRMKSLLTPQESREVNLPVAIDGTTRKVAVARRKIIFAS